LTHDRARMAIPCRIVGRIVGRDGNRGDIGDRASHATMDILSIVIALATGVAGARAAATLLPRAAPPRAISWIAGATGGVIAAAFAATAVAAQRVVPLPATATSGGVDVASMIGNAAAGAIGGIVLAIAAAVVFRIVRAR
jgi:hypothetical protein